MPTAVNSANSFLNLIYRAVAWANLADNAASSPAATLDLALHTAAPASSAQTSNEATYTSYARITITRGPGGWTLPAGGSLNNVALAQFAQCTGGTNTITHVSVGQGGTIIHYGALSAPVNVSNGIQPQFAIGACVVTIT